MYNTEMFYEGKPSMKKVWKFSNFSTADPSLASSHCLRPDLDPPGCCLFSDDLLKSRKIKRKRIMIQVLVLV